MIECMCKNTDFVENVKDKQIILFGASSAAKNFLLEYDVQDKILFIVDNDKKKAHTKFYFKTWEYDITTPDAFYSDSLKNYVIVVTSTYHSEIISQLQGMNVLKDIECYNYLLFEHAKYCDILPEKDNSGCCGCEACVQVCPVNCISMSIDKEGFAYPVTEQSKCTKCGLCNKVCTAKRKAERSDSINPEFFCVFSKEEEVLKSSSSGGVFSLLAEKIINRGGAVYGAESPDGMSVFHSRATTLEDYQKFRRSKYLQSRIGTCYEMAKADLEQGIPVLFSGTPCQIGGLYKFLQHPYDNLYTIDLICHGVPSKAVFDQYIEEIQNHTDSNIVAFNWRHQGKIGWKPHRIEMQFSDNRFAEIIDINGFGAGFLNSLFLRPSCYDCQYSQVPRIADITLGDFWGYEGCLVNENKNQGLSLVVLSTQKGKELFQCINSQITYESSSYQYVTDRTFHLEHSPVYNLKRENFFSDFESGKTYAELAKEYLDLDILEKFPFE